MSELAPLISDLALILICAGVMTLVFKRLKQPLVLGYIVAGFLASPHVPLTPSVIDVANIHTWSEIGVIFLLFALGLEFSFKKLVKVGGTAVIAACTIIFCMKVAEINAGFDPKRDQTVDPVLWEIRRERQMEFVFEHSRLLDIKRWGKLQYMNCTTHPDNLKGIWVNIPQEVPAYLVKAKIGKLQVAKADGTIVTYNGTNASSMVGYYIPEGAKDRISFDDKNYLSPVAKDQIDLYTKRGYNLTQTPLWN
jgi:hypothetical protein